MTHTEVFMSSYSSVTGVITQIQTYADNNSSSLGCTLLLSVRTQSQEEVRFTVTGDTYVVDNISLNPGDRVTFFYDSNTPVPLSYPPQYKAVAAALSTYYHYYLGEFNNSLISTDGTLQLNSSAVLNTYLPNGQIFTGAISGKIALVEYTTSTRSVPALVSPIRIFIFCYT